jgi:hypothetical protein
MNGREEGAPAVRAMNRRPRLLAGRLPAVSSSCWRLLAAASLLHVALAAGLFCVGRAQLAPRLFNRDGIMIISDSYEYQGGAARLAGVLKESGFGAWAAEPERAHVKLISILFACLGPLFGYGVLSAEPYNLFCYAAILSLVFMLGREVGGRRAGLLAAGTVALWPTFLLHTTQLFKDPLFIAAALALILIVTTWLTRTYSWAAALAMGALMAAAAGVLLLIRVKFGGFILAIVFFGTVLLVVRQLSERRLLYWNMMCPLLVLCAAALTPFHLIADQQRLKRYPSDQSGQPKSVAGPGRQVAAVISYRGRATGMKASPTYAARLRAAAETAALEIGSARYKFNVSWPESGSSIDRNVEYKDLRGALLYLPRAAEIGLWAPFPRTWIGAGKSVGRAGRLLSGAETLLMYLCELLALLGVWRAPRRLPGWLLLLITTFGVSALGLVVSNIGTLYRFRYLFWMLLIILGAKGLAGIVAPSPTEGAGSTGRAGRLKEVVLGCLLAAAVCSCSTGGGPARGDANGALRSSPGYRGANATAAAGASGSPVAASAGELDFALVNFAHLNLRAVYLSPRDSAGWEENVLGRDGLLDGEIVRIGFSPEEKSAEWDLRVEDNNGNYAEWKSLDLREISRLTLRRDNDVAAAEAQ